MNRKEEVLEYLKLNKSITQLQALQLFWNWRLSDTIYRLKKDGYNITSENIKVTKKDGTQAIVSKYTLIGE